MKQFKLIIFDLDGTLIDTIYRFYVVYNRVLNDFGLAQISYSYFLKLYEVNELREITERISDKFLPKFLEVYTYIKTDKDKLIPGALGALRELKNAGYLIAVVTGRIAPVEDVEKELGYYKLSSYIDVIETKWRWKNYGKNLLSKVPEIKSVLNQLNVAPNDAVVVGDHIVDILSGKVIGSYTVAVLSGGIRKEILESVKPNLILGSIAHLPHYMRKM
ncbi:MAG: HAD family hydrolase [Candidatus Odinarchaeia archaeon]